MEVVETIKATIIPHTPHTALRIRAERDCKVFRIDQSLCDVPCLLGDVVNLAM